VTRCQQQYTRLRWHSRYAMSTWQMWRAFSSSSLPVRVGVQLVRSPHAPCDVGVSHVTCAAYPEDEAASLESLQYRATNANEFFKVAMCRCFIFSCKQQ